MNYNESKKIIEKILLELIDENKKTPILVEGEKDIQALQNLGVKGIIISVNSGISLIDFCDKIADKYNEIIVLTDWDKKGGYLCHTIIKNLEGRVKCNTYYREILAKNSMIRTVEGLPSWIETMHEKNRNQ